MKKIFACLLVFGMLFTGCRKNPLNITPDGRLTIADIFKNEKQTEAYLNTIYGSIPSYFFRYQEWTFLAAVTDEAEDSDNGNYPTNIGTGWASGSLTPSYNPLEIWGNGNGMVRYPTYWAGIRNANIFLAHIGEANISNAGNRSRFTAEAKLLRAFFYLELIKQFGPMPVVEQEFTNDFDYTTLKRPTFQEVVDFIVRDCDEAIPDLGIRLTLGDNENGRFTKAVGYAIKSQALLYNASPLWNPTNDAAKWSAAAAASKEALDVLTAGGEYKLADNYSEYFLNKTDNIPNPKDKETIFERPDESTWAYTTVMGIPSKQGSYKVGVCPSQEMVDAYDMQATGEPAIEGYLDEDHLQPIVNAASGYDPNNPYVGRDPRFYATVWYNGATYDNINGNIHIMETYVGGADQLVKTPPNRLNTHTGYYLRKFIDPKLQVNQAQDARWKKYRLAEIYLNYAEAENEADGPTLQAYNAINTIRRRVDMPDLPLGLNQDQMRERIRRERRVELAMEEHRFWDVRRWKILNKTDKLVTGMEINKTGANSFTYKRFVTGRRNSWQDKFLIFPIPITEITNIPDFADNQNPGW